MKLLGSMLLSAALFLVFLAVYAEFRRINTRLGFDRPAIVECWNLPLGECGAPSDTRREREHGEG